MLVYDQRQVYEASSRYTRALEAVKSTFSGGSEKEHIASEIIGSVGNTGARALRWLDVGTGNGRFLHGIVRLVTKHGIAVDVTGIDPSSEDERSFKRYFPDGRFELSKFEDFSPPTTFDVITCVHSLYYIQAPLAALNAMVDLLAPGGLIVVSQWSRNCVLKNIHRNVWGAQPQAITAEAVLDHLTCLRRVDDAKLQDFVGLVDFSAWRESSELVSQASLVLSRKYGVDRVLQRDKRKLSSVLLQFGESGVRATGVISARRPAEVTT
jgi:SAM-dependent methyltransferase